jgi:hypothetical protein
MKCKKKRNENVFGFVFDEKKKNFDNKHNKM